MSMQTLMLDRRDDDRRPADGMGVLEKFNRLMTIALAVILAGYALFITVALKRARANERAADELAARLTLENSALKLAASQSWVAPLQRPLSPGGRP